MNDDEPPINRWGAEVGSTDVHNLDFDFEDYFSRHAAGTLTDEERRAFSGRVYGLFCKSFYESGGDPAAVPRWVMSYVADNLFKALQGGEWADVMRLPWDSPTPMYTPKGQRAMDIYCAIENRKTAEPSLNITSLIAWQAEERAVSYETARADYYAAKRAVVWKQWPKNFLTGGDDS